MDFAPSPRIDALSNRLDAFMHEHVHRVEADLRAAIDAGIRPGVPYPPEMVEVRERAKVTPRDETPLALGWRDNRMLRLVDGADELPKMSIVRRQVRRWPADEDAESRERTEIATRG